MVPFGSVLRGGHWRLHYGHTNAETSAAFGAVRIPGGTDGSVSGVVNTLCATTWWPISPGVLMWSGRRRRRRRRRRKFIRCKYELLNRLVRNTGNIPYSAAVCMHCRSTSDRKWTGYKRVGSVTSRTGQVSRRILYYVRLVGIQRQGNSAYLRHLSIT